MAKHPKLDAATEARILELERQSGIIPDVDQAQVEAETKQWRTDFIRSLGGGGAWPVAGAVSKMIGPRPTEEAMWVATLGVIQYIKKSRALGLNLIKLQREIDPSAVSFAELRRWLKATGAIPRRNSPEPHQQGGSGDLNPSITSTQIQAIPATPAEKETATGSEATKPAPQPQTEAQDAMANELAYLNQ